MKLIDHIIASTYLQVHPVCPLCGHAFRDATRSEIAAHIAAAHAHRASVQTSSSRTSRTEWNF